MRELAIPFRSQDSNCTCINCYHPMHRSCGYRVADNKDDNADDNRLCDLCAIDPEVFAQYGGNSGVSHADVLEYFHSVVAETIG